VIKKREAKVLDYERYRELLNRNEEIEPSLKESAEAYESINAQLCEEIPQFLNLCSDYIYIVIGDVIKFQQTFFDETRQVLITLFESMNVDPFSTTDSIIQTYMVQMKSGGEAEIAARRIKVIGGWADSLWMDGEYPQPVSSQSGILSEKLVDVSDAVGAPRLIHSQIDQDTVLQQRVSFEIMQPTVLPTYDYKVEALYRFEAEFEDELDMEIGDVITVVTDEERHGSDEWKFGISERGQGWFPKNYVQRL
jgi:hypothetical protein